MAFMKMIRPLLRVSISALSPSVHEIGGLASKVVIHRSFPMMVRRPGDGFHGVAVYRSYSAAVGQDPVRPQPDEERIDEAKGDEAEEDEEILELLSDLEKARRSQAALIEAVTPLDQICLGDESIPTGEVLMKLNPSTVEKVKELEKEMDGLLKEVKKVVSREGNFEDVMIKLGGAAVVLNTVELGSSLLAVINKAKQDGLEKAWEEQIDFLAAERDIGKKRMVYSNLVVIEEYMKKTSLPKSEDEKSTQQTSEDTLSSDPDPTPTPTPTPTPPTSTPTLTEDATPTPPPPSPSQGAPTPDSTPTPPPLLPVWIPHRHRS